MPGRPDFPKIEEDILEFWKKSDIFRKSLDKPSPRGNFVFFEGPPTANGRPGIHHVEARAYKDVIPRFRTMQGYFVERKAGWDTHGLPVELEVEKQLGISGKPQIESLKNTPRESIAHFNSLCKESVWKYLEDWNALTDRIGFWLDLENPYVTYYNSYIESLWWIVKRIHERGLLYKDYKVVPYCARCGTPLSSHELALGYDEAEDPSIYVKFGVKGSDNVYLLAWTTTPWTLPGNVALAVGENVDYVKIEVKNNDAPEFMILAKARLAVIEDDYKIIEEMKGADLLGLEYEPLYKFVEFNEKAHYVAAADFVSTEDGTGIVHTAVMYGAEDFELGQKLGLPKKHLVDSDGKFIPEVKPWDGMFVKDANPKIIEELKSRGLLHHEEKIRHTYPFCWRCKSPLIYYARDSWFVKMSALRGELIKRNETINWMPSYMKEGRFGEWLREVKDWAFTRERYWGTPMPVWVCSDCGGQKVIGSFAEFPETESGNTYYLMRHGWAAHNELRGDPKGQSAAIVADVPGVNDRLTDKGREDVRRTAEKLKREGGIDLIFSSPFLRAKESAEIAAEMLGAPIEIDDRLWELRSGVLSGKTVAEYNAFFKNTREKFEKAPEGGETLRDVVRRMSEFIREIDGKRKNKKILIVGHGDPLWVLEGALLGKDPAGIIEFGKEHYITKGEARKVALRKFPFREDGFFDPHRPYIDEVKFTCRCGHVMERTSEVIDVWFDSGAMPFAEWHYPFENSNRIDHGINYPADYIAEAQDQTRGWFYTLLAVAALLEKDAPYKNVIVLGLLLDKEGKKMSKSVGNVVDPWEMVQKYGADAVRWYMYTVNQPGDAKNFDENDLDLIVRQNFMLLWNVLVFWKLYGEHLPLNPLSSGESKKNHVMDEWILARLEKLTRDVTQKLESYDITGAARAIAAFISELSTWYVRRSRGRFKDGDKDAPRVLGNALLALAKLMAPFVPFFAEYLYKEVGKEAANSVHLASWPKAGEIDEKLLNEMELVRKSSELGHAIRSSQKIKVRQPLSAAVISGVSELRPELLQILAEELNVKSARIENKLEHGKEYEVREQGGISIGLDLKITPELLREGNLRELIRNLNELRKEAGLTISDLAEIKYETENIDLRDILEHEQEKIKKSALASRISFGRADFGREFSIGGQNIWLGIERKG